MQEKSCMSFPSAKMLVQTSCPFPSPLWSIENSLFSWPSNSSFSTTSCTPQGLKLDGGLQRFGRSENLETKNRVEIHFWGSMLKYICLHLSWISCIWNLLNISKIVNQIERYWHNVEPLFKKYSKHQAWLLSRLKASHKALPQDSNVDITCRRSTRSIESMGFHLHWTHFPPFSMAFLEKLWFLSS